MSKRLLNISIIVAIYVVLCLILEPISFGPIQFRLSEILCLLSIEFPFVIYGVSVGCFISNLLFGGFGLVDAIVGSFASYLACALAYLFGSKRFHNLPIISCLFIVVINAIIVGFEFGIIYQNKDVILLSMIQIGISELLVMIIALPFYEKITFIFRKLIQN